MERMHILHTVEMYAPHIGGAELVVQRISEGLAKRGHRVTVATRKLPERMFTALNGVDVVEFDVRGNPADGIKGPDVERYLEFLQYFPADIMMNYAAQQWATDLALRAVVAGKARPVNIIAPCGYSALDDKCQINAMGFGTYYRVVVPQALRRYDAAIYHSALYKDYRFAEKLGLSNSEIIPNAVDEAEFDPHPSVNFREKYGITTKFLLLSVGNYLEAKGQDKVIEAFKSLAQHDATLVFIGQDYGFLDTLKERAAGLRVKFLSGIPRVDTVAAYKAADLFLFGSTVEASPLVIIEAKAAKLPFISTDCGNVKEFQGGIVCSTNEMGYAADQLLTNHEARSKFGEIGWKEWQERFTMKVVLDKYEQLYWKFIRNKFHSTDSLERGGEAAQQLDGAYVPAR